MKSLCVNAKLQNGQFKSSKLTFCKFNGQFEREGKGQGHQFLKKLGELKMINTHLKFQSKIPNGLKVVAFTRNYTKFYSFQGQIDLEGQGQGHQFSNLAEIFR